MIKMLRTAAAAGLMAVAVSSQAAVVFSDTFTAPGAGGNPAGYYYFAGHTAEQTFAGTGLTEVDRMTLTLRLVGDQNYATENLGLTFSLNGTDIGSTLYAAGVDDDKNLDFSFTALDSASGDWTVKMRVTTPVCSGCGAVQMGRENPMSLFGSTAVPEPATLAMVGIALLGMGVSRRRSAQPTEARAHSRRAAQCTWEKNPPLLNRSTTSCRSWALRVCSTNSISMFWVGSELRARLCCTSSMLVPATATTPPWWARVRPGRCGLRRGCAPVGGVRTMPRWMIAASSGPRSAGGQTDLDQ